MQTYKNNSSSIIQHILLINKKDIVKWKKEKEENWSTVLFFFFFGFVLFIPQFLYKIMHLYSNVCIAKQKLTLFFFCPPPLEYLIASYFQSNTSSKPNESLLNFVFFCFLFALSTLHPDFCVFLVSALPKTPHFRGLITHNL